MSLRLFVESPLHADLEFPLPGDAARHVQVRRLQPGDDLRLFDGTGGEWQAQVLRMGKRDVDVRIVAHEAVNREFPFDLEVALGMPANERMDALIEKATELGVAAIQPLQSERSVLRLDADRAAKRVAHWQAVAVSASEQSGRTRVPHIAPVRTMGAWLATQSGAEAVNDFKLRVVMSTGVAPGLRGVVDAALASSSEATAGTTAATTASTTASTPRDRWLALSGPEGGLSREEETAAIEAGFLPISLGGLILRADTAPLAWLARMAQLLQG